MSAHTPGPWAVSHLDCKDQAVVKAEHFEVATCWHHCVASIEKEMHANARLIAAAPELYEALKNCLGWAYRAKELEVSGSMELAVTEDIAEACAALAKAEGKEPAP